MPGQYERYGRYRYDRRRPYDDIQGRGMGPAISPPKRPLGDLQTRKFEPTDIIERLVANSDRYDKTPVEREDSFDRDSNEPNTAEWDELARTVNQLRESRGDKGPDLAKYEGMPLDIKEPEPNIFWKGVNALTEPLSGGYFGRKAREISGDVFPGSEKEELFQSTGKGDLQDWLAWGEATFKGARRGAFEGVGDLMDQFTAPADIAGLALGGGALGAASKGWRAANALRRGAQVSGIPLIAHGGRGMYESGRDILTDPGENDWENVKKFGSSALETAMGGAQMHFPSAALDYVSPAARTGRAAAAKAAASPTYAGIGPKPLVRGRPLEPSGTGPEGFRREGPEPDFASGAEVTRPFGRGRLNQQEIRPIRSYQDRGIAEDFDQGQGVDLDLELRQQQESELPRARTRPLAPEPVPEPITAQEPEAATPQTEIEKMMVGREPGTRLDLGVQESPLVDPNARIEELYAKGNNLTAAENAELDKLIDSQAKPLTERLGDLFKRGPEGESGSYDPNWLDKMRRRARMKRMGRVEPPPEAGRFPGEEPTNIGAVPEREIDLEQAMLEAGSDLAKPIPPKRPGLLEDEAGAAGPGERKPQAETFQQFIARVQKGMTWERFQQLPEEVRQRAAEMYRKSQSEATAAAPPKLIKPGGETVEAQATAAGIGQVEAPPAPVEKPAKAAKAPKAAKEKPLQETLKEIYPEEAAAPTVEPVVMGGESKIARAGLDPEVAFGPEGDVTAIRKQKELLDRGSASDVKYKALLPKALHGKLAKGETHRSRLNQLLDATAPITPEQEAKFNADYETRQIEKNRLSEIPESFEESIETPPGPSSGLRSKDYLKQELKEPPKKMKPRSKIWGGTKNWFRQFKDEDKGEIDIDMVLELMGARRKPRPAVEYGFDWPGFHETGEAERMYHVMEGQEKGSTLSETSLRDREIPIPEGDVNLPPEFSKDIKQFDESIPEAGEGATSPRFERSSEAEGFGAIDDFIDQAIPSETAPSTSMWEKIKTFMADESGEMRFPRFRDMSREDAQIIIERTDLRRRLIEQWKALFPDWKSMSRQDKIASQKDWLTSNAFLAQEGGINPKYQAQMELEYNRPATMEGLRQGVEEIEPRTGEEIYDQIPREETPGNWDEEAPVHQPDEYGPLPPLTPEFEAWKQKADETEWLLRERYGQEALNSMRDGEYRNAYHAAWRELHGEEATIPPRADPEPTFTGEEADTTGQRMPWEEEEALGVGRMHGPEEVPTGPEADELSALGEISLTRALTDTEYDRLIELQVKLFGPEMDPRLSDNVNPFATPEEGGPPVEQARSEQDNLVRDNATYNMLAEEHGREALRTMPEDQYHRLFDEMYEKIFGEDMAARVSDESTKPISPEQQGLVEILNEIDNPPPDDPLGRNREYSTNILQRDQAVRVEMSRNYGRDQVNAMSDEQYWQLYDEVHNEMFGESHKPTPSPTEGERNLFDERMNQRRGIIEQLKKFMGEEEGSAEVPEWAKRVAGLGRESAVPPPRMQTEAGAGGGPRRPTGSQEELLFGDDQVPKGMPIERQKEDTYEPSTARKVWDTGQSFMSVDLPFMTSAAFRQASPLMWTDNWFKAWGKSMEAFSSKEAYDAIMKEILGSKYFTKRYKPQFDSKGKIKGYKEIDSVAEEAGVRMSDVRNHLNREETLRKSLAEEVPLYGDYIMKSNRAYTAFLNSLRKAKFEQMMDARDWSGVGDNQAVAKQIAEFVNDATGRSTLRMKTPLGEVNAEKNANALAMALWSPRLVTSRMRFLNPMTYMGLDPEIRKEYLSGLFRTLGSWGAFAGLARMMGAEVSADPRSSDFGKIKIGNTRIDPGAGFQQLLVFAARMGTGEFVSSRTGQKTEMGEGFKPRTRRTTAEEFAASKLHPSAKLAWDLLGASQSSPVHVGDRAVQMVLPMMAQDMWEVFQSDPELAPLLGALSSVGMGTANYGRSDEYGAPVFTDDIEKAFGLPHRGTWTAGTVGGKRPRSY